MWHSFRWNTKATTKILSMSSTFSFPWNAPQLKLTSCLCFESIKKLTGDLDDCNCDVETIDAFNNEQLHPKLQTLLESDYFRFYKVTGARLVDLSGRQTNSRGCDLLFVSALTSSAGEPEQSLSFLDSGEPLRYEGLCRQALFSCWFIFLMYKQHTVLGC